VFAIGVNAFAQDQPVPPPVVADPPSTPQPAAIVPAPGQTEADVEEQKRQKAEEQLEHQKHQRILGIIPAFNASNVPDAVSLTPKQKFSLAFRSAVDPFQFALVAVGSGISQIQNNFPEYGQGVEGYAKRYGAGYLDNFDGFMLGNAVLPIVFREDPRYFRKGTGSVPGRLLYAVASTLRCKTDSGHWAPNYGNLLGNLAAGGISNLYYPESDRGASLTVQRAIVVSAYGAIGALAYEFWPDAVARWKRHHQTSGTTP
jgi:hypothetical protein